MRTRIAAFVIATFDTFGWLLVAVNTYWSGSDPATIGFDHAAGVIVSGLYLITGFPALVLAGLNRRLCLSLALALAFPGVFAVLFIAAIFAFA